MPRPSNYSRIKNSYYYKWCISTTGERRWLFFSMLSAWRWLFIHEPKLVVVKLFKITTVIVNDGRFPNFCLSSSQRDFPLTNVDCVWNVKVHAQKPDFVFRRNGPVHLNRWGRQFSRLLAAEVCASAVVMVVMLDTPCSEVVWRVLATHSILQFPLHFPSRASPCAITFQLDSTTNAMPRLAPVCCTQIT
jgi:hypothetical protein